MNLLAQLKEINPNVKECLNLSGSNFLVTFKNGEKAIYNTVDNSPEDVRGIGSAKKVDWYIETDINGGFTVKWIKSF